MSAHRADRDRMCWEALAKTWPFVLACPMSAGACGTVGSDHQQCALADTVLSGGGGRVPSFGI